MSKVTSTWTSGPEVSQQNVTPSITLPPPARLPLVVHPGVTSFPGKQHARTGPSPEVKPESSDQTTFLLWSISIGPLPTVGISVVAAGHHRPASQLNKQQTVLQL